MARTTAKTAKKERQGFQPGKSGNPKGRPHGSRNKATLAVEALLDGQAEALTQVAIQSALEGDLLALRLCLDRICPPRKSRPIQVKLPKIETAANIAAAQTVVIAAMAQGDLTPDEAGTVAGVLEARRRTFETTEIEERLARLEAEGAEK